MEWIEVDTNDANTAELQAQDIIADGIVANLYINQAQQSVTLDAPNGKHVISSLAELDAATQEAKIADVKGEVRGLLEVIFQGFQS